MSHARVTVSSPVASNIPVPSTAHLVAGFSARIPHSVTVLEDSSTTTEAATEWLLLCGLNHNEISLSLCLRIAATASGSTPELVCSTKLPELNYVKACVKESFRLHPVVPFNVPRVSTTNNVVAGFFIPKGSHVLLSRLALGQDPNEWDEPLAYRPERHIKEDGTHQVVFSESDLRIFSFSIGRRGCPGVQLSSTITTMLMARLLQGFIWHLPPNVSKIELKGSAHDLLLQKPLIALAKPILNEEIYVSL